MDSSWCDISSSGLPQACRWFCVYLISNWNGNYLNKSNCVIFLCLHDTIVNKDHSPISLLTNALSLSSSKTPTNDPSTFPPLMAITDGTAVTYKQIKNIKWMSKLTKLNIKKKKFIARSHKTYIIFFSKLRDIINVNFCKMKFVQLLCSKGLKSGSQSFARATPSDICGRECKNKISVSTWGGVTRRHTLHESLLELALTRPKPFSGNHLDLGCWMIDSW